MHDLGVSHPSICFDPSTIDLWLLTIKLPGTYREKYIWRDSHLFLLRPCTHSDKVWKIKNKSTKGGRGQRWVDFPLRKTKTSKKCKDDQNDLIHPENWGLKFFIIGEARSNFWADFIFISFNFLLWPYLLKYGR